jgi:DNA-binding Lrp family transcriptional regulator
MQLDKIDLKILKILQQNARTTNLALSEQVSMSASACLARVQKLRDAGIIDRDVAVISPSKIGPSLHAFLEVTLVSHSLADHVKFEEALKEIPEITACFKVSGRFDYLISITTTDMPALSELSDKLLDATLGVTKLVTVPILDVAKPFSGMPVEILGNHIKPN